MNKFTLKTRLESLFIYPVSYQRVEKVTNAGPEARARRVVVMSLLILTAFPATEIAPSHKL